MNSATNARPPAAAWLPGCLAAWRRPWPQPPQLPDSLVWQEIRRDVEALMKRCQVGTGGRHALEQAHDVLAECYGALGWLVQALEAERDWLVQALEAERGQLAQALEAERVRRTPAPPAVPPRLEQAGPGYVHLTISGVAIAADEAELRSIAGRLLPGETVTFHGPDDGPACAVTAEQLRGALATLDAPKTAAQLATLFTRASEPVQAALRAELEGTDAAGVIRFTVDGSTVQATGAALRGALELVCQQQLELSDAMADWNAAAARTGR